MFYALVHLIDLYLLLFFFCVALALVVWAVTFVLSSTRSVNFNKAFNCGFNIDEVTQGYTLNIRFFVVGLLFLLFDIEILILLPLSLGATEDNYASITGFFFFFFRFDFTYVCRNK